MLNQNMMFMNNMENQSNSKDINIEEIIKPFKEKIRKLQDEISEKDSEIAQLKFKLMQYDNGNKANNQFINNNMGQMNNQMNNNMGQMNYQMNPMNNNGNQMSMNMINNPFNMMNNQFNMNNMMNNFMMNNQMNQMDNMGSQINEMENEKLPRMEMGYQNQLIKNLSIEVRMEKGEAISVNCRSNDKMKNLIQKFCTKACIDKVEDYDFIIIKKEEAKLDSSIEENGIKQKDYILAIKKLDKNMEGQVDQSLNDKKESYFIEENPKILGEPIVVYFDASTGQKVSIPIGLNNTIKDAFILFCNKMAINYSDIEKEIFFIYNGRKLECDDITTLKQIGIRNNISITVFDQGNVVGA